MQQTPAGWPAPSDVETVPEFRLAASTDWLPESITPVSQVSIRRDLTGGGLPGSARAGSGFSVADGSVTIPQPATGARVTPWGGSGVRAMPGGSATIQALSAPASPAHPDAILPLGEFIIDKVSGADSSGEISLDLIEDQRRMDTPFTYAWGYNSLTPTMDAAAVLAAAVTAAGYSTGHYTRKYFSGTNAPAEGLYFPLEGAVSFTDMGSNYFWDQSNATLTAASGITWGTIGGVSMLTSGAIRVATTGSNTWYWSGPPNVVVVVAGDGATIRRSMGGSTTTGYALKVTSKQVTAYSGTTVTGTANLPASNAPYRVLAITGELDNLFKVTDLVTGQSVIVPGSDGDLFYYDTIRVDVATTAGSGIRDLLVTSASIYAGTGSNYIQYTPPGARIEATGSPLSGVFDVAGSSARDVFQDIARATMGAGWQDETGTIIYRNAESLRTGAPVETVIADGQLEDVPWEISRENTADRIELTYTPASVVTDPQGKITLWEMTELVQVLAKRTITLYADITGTTDTIASFLPIWDTTSAGADGTRYSRWAAASQPDGGGTRPADDALSIATEIVSPSRIRITITNTTNGRLWLVDGNGNPCLILRTTRQVTPGEQETIAWGAPEESAQTPFAFDCGQWVQDATVAQRMLDWLSSQMASPMATIPAVNVKPDLARQLGDIVILTEEPQGDDMPLLAKALITGMDLSGDANGYDTTLTLALLGVTFSDLDAWATENSAITFDQFDTWCTDNGITTFDDFDGYAAAGVFY